LTSFKIRSALSRLSQKPSTLEASTAFWRLASAPIPSKIVEVLLDGDDERFRIHGALLIKDCLKAIIRMARRQ